jgi:NAD(P)H-dependent FMN reductase
MASENTSKVLVFAGSTRNDSFNRKLGLAVAHALRSAGIETTWADLKDYPMPLYDGDTEAARGLPEHALAFKALLARHEVFVIASPEYNGSFPALIKNVIDWTSRATPGEKPLAAYRGKLAAILSTSPGSGGGRRGLEHLRSLLERIGVTVIPEQLAVPKAAEAFDAEGVLVRPEDREGLDQLVAALAAAMRERLQAA